MAETELSTGQAEADSPGTTADAPSANAGNSEGHTQTTASGPGEAMESFFDPSSIKGKPELESAYKQMQSAFTKRMQETAAHRSKIEAYDRFQQNPVETMQQLAASLGYKMVQGGTEQPKDWNPQSWDDVMAEAEKRVLKKMEPVYGELRQLKKQSVEGYLDSNYADWRTYEDDMLKALQTHPSLANDPDALYRLAVPSEVWEARAMKTAMQKLKTSGDAATVQGGNKTTRPTTSEPTGPLTFDQAVEIAKKRVASAGLSRPAG